MENNSKNQCFCWYTQVLLKGWLIQFPSFSVFFEKNRETFGSDIFELVGSTGLRFGHTTYHYKNFRFFWWTCFVNIFRPSQGSKYSPNEPKSTKTVKKKQSKMLRITFLHYNIELNCRCGPLVCRRREILGVRLVSFWFPLWFLTHNLGKIFCPTPEMSGKCVKFLSADG